MAQTSTESLNLTIEDAAASWQRHLRAANKAPRTITGYLDAVTRFGAYLADVGMPRDVAAIRREHVESWVVAMQDAGHRPASVANRYRSLRVFFNWLVSEEEITRSPMV
jgi:site-specific recombinase XerC